MSATIRPMHKRDLDAVVPLAASLVRQHHTFDAKRFMVVEPVEDGYRWFLGTQLGLKNVVLLVAEAAGSVAGYFYGSVEERDWEMLLDAHGAVHDVFVGETFRRQGIARQLVEAGAAALEQLGAKRLVLYSAAPNEPAQQLFAALGFRRTMVEMTRG